MHGSSEALQVLEATEVLPIIYGSSSIIHGSPRSSASPANEGGTGGGGSSESAGSTGGDGRPGEALKLWKLWKHWRSRMEAPEALEALEVRGSSGDHAQKLLGIMHGSPRSESTGTGIYLENRKQNLPACTENLEALESGVIERGSTGGGESLVIMNGSLGDSGNPGAGSPDNRVRKFGSSENSRVAGRSGSSGDDGSTGGDGRPKIHKRKLWACHKALSIMYGNPGIVHGGTGTPESPVSDGGTRAVEATEALGIMRGRVGSSGSSGSPEGDGGAGDQHRSPGSLRSIEADGSTRGTDAMEAMEALGVAESLTTMNGCLGSSSALRSSKEALAIMHGSPGSARNTGERHKHWKLWEHWKPYPLNRQAESK